MKEMKEKDAKEKKGGKRLHFLDTNWKISSPIFLRTERPSVITGGLKILLSSPYIAIMTRCFLKVTAFKNACKVHGVMKKLQKVSVCLNFC